MAGRMTSSIPFRRYSATLGVAFSYPYGLRECYEHHEGRYPNEGRAMGVRSVRVSASS
jgi:hypothetical protein